MRTLTVKMEEIESTAIMTSRVTIKKMETRIEELEVLYEREKKMHVETMSALHMKDRRVCFFWLDTLSTDFKIQT